VELFTGAQSSVRAVDVAFDALSPLQPTDLSACNIICTSSPRPADQQGHGGRAEYYGDELHGTPSLFFNGASALRGAPSRRPEKYQELRTIVDSELDSVRDARVELSAHRSGDKIEIKASARLSGIGRRPRRQR